MLQVLGGLVTLGLLGLSLVIGVRLLRLSARTRGPELWLGLYFVLYGFVATSLSVATYLGWSSPQPVFTDAVTRALNGSFFAFSTAGMTCLMVFTWRTFRPGARGARAAALATGVLLASAAASLGVGEGFEVRVLNGPAYWVHFTARLAPWIWVAAESLAYRAKLRRRLALGLAEPVVANRFLLWGVWGATMAGMAFVDPLARLWYWWLTGTTERWIVEAGRPIIELMIPISCALGMAVAAVMVLTFFPTPAYRRWVEARAARASA
jgi:hypothetical protein